MDFPSTQIVGDDASLNLSLNSSSSDNKTQIGTLEAGSKKYPIFNGLTKVGRHPTCEICFSDGTVSKIHAEIEADGKSVFICDLNSSNKTRLNEHILRPERFYSVQDGASLKFGIIDTRFFLVHPEDSSLLAPETPDRELCVRRQEHDDDSLVEVTPRANDDSRFRRPFPVRASTSQNPARTSTTTSTQSQSPASKKVIQNLDIDDDNNVDLENMETQVSSTEQNNIQDLETQAISESHKTNRNFQKEKIKPSTSEATLNIEDMETQKLNMEETTLEASKATRYHECNIEDLETQFNSPQLDIQGLETQVSIDKEVVQEDKCQKLSSKRFSEHQRNIEDIKTQIFGADEPKSASSDDEEIHDLPTQPNSHHSECLKSNNQPDKNNRSASSSPDLLANANNLIIADSDAETDEEGIFANIQLKTNEKLEESKSSEGKDAFCGNNVDDKEKNNASVINDDSADTSGFKKVQLSRTRGDKAKFRSTGIVSDSDSDEENRGGIALVDNKENSRRAQFSEAKEKTHYNSTNTKTTDHSENKQEDEGSDTDFDENDTKNLENSTVCSNGEASPKISLQTSEKSAKNSSKKFSSSDCPDLPLKVLQMLNTSKNSEDSDSDDPYSAPTQRISLPEAPTVSENSKKSAKNISASSNTSKNTSVIIEDSDADDDADPTQIIDFQNPQETKNQDIDDMEPTQVISMVSTIGNKNSKLPEIEDIDDHELAATQKIHIPIAINQRVEKTILPESIDDLAPTQVIHIAEDNKQTIVDKSIKTIESALEEDLAPTQVMTVFETQSPQVEEKQSSSRKNKFDDLDDVEPKNDDELEKKTRMNSSEMLQDFPKNTSRGSKRTILVSSDEEVSKPSKSRRLKGDKSEKTPVKNSGDITTSTPLRASPTKGKKFNLSLRSRREVDSAFEEEERSTDNHAKSSTLDDSIDKNLDSMFGGENNNDQMDLDNRSPLMTQQVLDILLPTQQQPEKNTTVEKLSKSTKNSKKQLKEYQEVQEESQDVYFSNLKGKKRKTILESQKMSDDEKNVVSKPATSESSKATQKVSSRKSSRLSYQVKSKKAANDEENCQDVSKIDNRGTNACPGSPASSVGSARSPSTSKVTRRGKQPISEIKDKKNHESDDDEDFDFEKVSAMADTYLASKPGRSPGRPKKTTAQTSTEALIKNKENSEKSSAKGKKVKDPESPAKTSSPQIVKKLVETPKRRGIKKKKEAEESVIDISENVSTLKMDSNDKKNEEKGKKRGRPKKTDEEGQIPEKKRRTVEDSSEGGLESQEIQRILTSADADTGGRVSKGMDRKYSTPRTNKEKTKPADVPVTDSPSKAVRSKNKVEGESIKHQVLLTKVDNEAEEISNSVAILGGTIATDPLKATILVTDKIRRTLKFFVAVARSIPIVTIAWLEASKKAQRFLDPGKFLLQDSQTEKKFKFSLKKSLAKAAKERMLKGYTILITQNITGPTIAEIKTMIQVSGGKPLVRPPKKWPENSVIVTCQQDLPGITKSLAKTGDNIPVVNMEFLLSGILRQQVSYDEFRFEV